MKKLLALTLAVCMVMSLATVAFANPANYYTLDDFLDMVENHPEKGYFIGDNYFIEDTEEIYPEEEGTLVFGEKLLLPIHLVEKDHKEIQSEEYNEFIEYMEGFEDDAVEEELFDVFGHTIFPYEEAPVSDYNKEFKLSVDWEMGEEYVEGVKISFKNIDSEVLPVIEIETKELPLDEEKDVIGTITVKAKKAVGGQMDSSDIHDLGDIVSLFDTPIHRDGLLPFHFISRLLPDLEEMDKEVKIDVAFTISPISNKWYYKAEHDITDEFVVYDFDDGEEEEELNLYGNMGTFYVNTIGQGDLVIRANVEYNKGIEAIDKDAAYVYYNGNGATFNKIGTLYLNAEYGDILYKVNDDGTLTKLEGNYDTDEDAFKLRTRKLGSYVIAEKELDLEKINAAILADK